MKHLHLIFIFFLYNSLSAQAPLTLDPCPNSPNCVSTLAKKKSQKMAPLQLYGSADKSKALIKKIVGELKGTELIDESALYLHYTFKTRFGNFTDDVEFLIDTTENLIHFRSASRIGYGDLGANKRRMRKISRSWINKSDSKKDE
jgi:uncharacterized protein (DUF1499 family)